MSGIPARGRPRSEARTAEILWAAAQLFARRGVAATTTREIAQQAGTTERTLFKHFGSKEQLVHAVLEEAVLAHLAPASLSGLTQAIEAFQGDLQAWHRALLAARLQALSAAPELTRLLLAELLRDDTVRRRFAQEWTHTAWEPLVQLFGQLQRQRRVRADATPQQLTRQFLSLNLGFLIARLLLAPEYPWDDEAEMAALAGSFSRAVEGLP
jgi:AcrR family transcriptional regulator